MRTLILVMVFSFTIYTSYAQNIEGIVFDARTNQPIDAVHVYINKSQQGTLTNTRGKFKIKTTANLSENDTIYFSHINYQKQGLPYVKDKSKYLVYLTPQVNTLEEIQVVANKKLKSDIQFNKLTSMKNGRYAFGSVIKDDIIYIIGGDVSYQVDENLKTLENNPDISFIEFLNKTRANFSTKMYRGDLLLYNIHSDSWETSDLNFRKRANHNINLYGDKIYVLGGKRVSRNGAFEYLDDKIEVLDLKTNTVIVDDTNPHQAANFESFLYKDNLIVLGGSIKQKNNGQKVYSNKVHMYNLKSGLWYDLATMPSAKETRGILINDKIYTFGGFNKKPLKEIESFDLISGKWAREGVLFSDFNKPAITHANNMVYLFENGKLASFNCITKELKEYSINLFLSAAELQYADEKLYILGGLKDENYTLSASDGLYRVDLNEFETTAVNQSAKL
tara:strand:- start:499973 stop:501319 length:1347 start_codon:yes stop_codon:yes gene_type:complete